MYLLLVNSQSKAILEQRNGMSFSYQKEVFQLQISFQQYQIRYYKKIISYPDRPFRFKTDNLFYTVIDSNRLKFYVITEKDRQIHSFFLTNFITSSVIHLLEGPTYTANKNERHINTLKRADSLYLISVPFVFLCLFLLSLLLQLLQPFPLPFLYPIKKGEKVNSLNSDTGKFHDLGIVNSPSLMIYFRLQIYKLTFKNHQCQLKIYHLSRAITYINILKAFSHKAASFYFKTPLFPLFFSATKQDTTVTQYISEK